MRKCTPFTTIADVLQKETRHYLKKFKIEGIIEPHDGMVYDYSIMVTFWLLLVTFWLLHNGYILVTSTFPFSWSNRLGYPIACHMLIPAGGWVAIQFLQMTEYNVLQVSQNFSHLWS